MELIKTVFKDNPYCVCYPVFFDKNSTYDFNARSMKSYSSSNYKENKKQEFLEREFSIDTKIPMALLFRDLKMTKEYYEKINNFLKDEDQGVIICGNKVFKQIPDPDYDDQMKEYEENMKEYNIVMENWKIFRENCGDICLKFYFSTNNDDEIVIFQPSPPSKTIESLVDNEYEVDLTMNQNTRLYQFLLNEGILKSRYPKWFE